MTQGNIIVVTGATGFIGQAFIRSVVNDDKEYLCITRRPEIADRLVGGANIRYVPGQLEDSASVSRYFENACACVHLAAETVSARPGPNRRANVEVTRNVVSLCRQHGVGRLVFTSSISATFPRLGIYGRSKLEAQNIVLESGLPCIVLQPTMVYGPGDRGVSKTVNLLKRLPVIPIVGSGRALMQPVFVDDVAYVIRSALRSFVGKKVYYVGGPEQFTFNEYIDRLCRHIGVRKPKIHTPFRLWYYAAAFFALFGDMFPISAEQCLSVTSNQSGSNDDARRDFSYSPIGFEEGMKRYLPGKQ